jgi:allantoinase
VDVGFWGGVVPGNAADLDALVDGGVRGFKCFLVPSGVDEFAAVDEDDLRQALPVLARRNVPLLVHAESPSVIAECGSRNADSNPQSYAAYLASRPPSAEVEAIRLMARLAAEFRAHIHIVHVSSAEGVDAIAAAKAASVRITAETCPHYLTFAAAEIPDGATEFKCAPPIRDSAHREALWRGLDSGVLDLIATDHSPAPPSLKRPDGVGDFVAAWGGIASIELSLAATWTSLKSSVGLGVTRAGAGTGTAEAVPYVPPGTAKAVPYKSDGLCLLARWLSAAPAALAGLGRRKGQIASGFDADLVVWDPDGDFVVDPLRLHQRHKLTPYAGRSLAGSVATTFVRGERVWDKDRLTRAYGGQLL